MMINDLKKMQLSSLELNIKPYISVIWELYMHEYARKRMIVGEKIDL